MLISALLAGLLLIKAAIAALATRLFEASTFKAARTGIVMSIGGEFGIALLTLVLQGGAVPLRIAQPLLVAVVLSMVLSPFILANNARIARLVLRERRPELKPLGPAEYEPTGTIAQREHVILCGYGRVGQSVARVLESQGFEYIALDLDPARIRAARQAGEPVLYGDSADEDMLVSAGCDHASAVVISFSSIGVALAIVRTVRRLRADVPILVRTVDDSRAPELLAAGATQIIPETFEMGLILVGATLRTLSMPVCAGGAHARAGTRQSLRAAEQCASAYRVIRAGGPAGATRRAADRRHSAGRLGGRTVGGRGSRARRGGGLHGHPPTRDTGQGARRGHAPARRATWS